MRGEAPIREFGEVKRLEGELVVIEIARATACAGCAASGVCHSLGGSDLRELRAVNAIHAEPGDQVEVEVRTKDALKAALWVYALPTLLMVVTAVFFHEVVAAGWKPEAAQLGTAIATLGSLGLLLLVVTVWRRMRGASTKGYPIVVRRL